MGQSTVRPGIAGNPRPALSALLFLQNDGFGDRLGAGVRIRDSAPAKDAKAEFNVDKPPVSALMVWVINFLSSVGFMVGGYHRQALGLPYCDRYMDASPVDLGATPLCALPPKAASKMCPSFGITTSRF